MPASLESKLPPVIIFPKNEPDAPLQAGDLILDIGHFGRNGRLGDLDQLINPRSIGTENAAVMDSGTHQLAKIVYQAAFGEETIRPMDSYAIKLSHLFYKLVYGTHKGKFNGSVKNVAMRLLPPDLSFVTELQEEYAKSALTFSVEGQLYSTKQQSNGLEIMLLATLHAELRSRQPSRCVVLSTKNDKEDQKELRKHVESLILNSQREYNLALRLAYGRVVRG